MEDDNLDGCELDFDDPETNTAHDGEIDALVMFADCWDDPEKVEQRRAELVEWSAG